MKKALIVIDIQNDYFENGKLPLWNTENTLNNVERAIKKANANNIPVILIQHASDGFHKTNLGEVLSQLGVEEILVCGMMTQNCVVFTAISKEAEKYSVKILSDCCTTVNEQIHLIALPGVSTRVELLNYNEAM